MEKYAYIVIIEFTTAQLWTLGQFYSRLVPSRGFIYPTFYSTENGWRCLLVYITTSRMFVSHVRHFFDVWNSNHDTIIAMVQFWFNPATGEGEQNYCASRSIARANCHLFSSRYLLKSSSVRAPAPQSLSEKLTGMFFAVSLFSHSSECGFIDFLLPHASRLRFQFLPWEWTS